MGGEMISYLDRKEAIREELKRVAKAGRTITYSELGRRVGIPPMGPWKPILDTISKEQSARRCPDITFVVINQRTGLPGQIGFKPATKPTPEQMKLAREKLQEVFSKYCPGKSVPF
jgi:hypothetical protein